MEKALFLTIEPASFFFTLISCVALYDLDMENATTGNQLRY